MALHMIFHDLCEAEVIIEAIEAAGGPGDEVTVMRFLDYLMHRTVFAAGCGAGGRGGYRGGGGRHPGRSHGRGPYGPGPSQGMPMPMPMPGSRARPGMPGASMGGYSFGPGPSGFNPFDPPSRAGSNYMPGLSYGPPGPGRSRGPRSTQGIPGFPGGGGFPPDLGHSAGLEELFGDFHMGPGRSHGTPRMPPGPTSGRRPGRGGAPTEFDVEEVD